MSIPVALRPSPFQARVSEDLGPDDFIDVGGMAVPLWMSDPEAEYAAFRTTAGMIDFSMLLKWEVSGPDAVGVVDAVFSRDVRKVAPGSIAYGVVVDDRGMMVDDCTVLVYGADRVRLTGGNPRVGELLAEALTDGHSLIELRDQIATLSLQGPRSREILQKLTPVDVSNEAFPYYTFQVGVPVAGIPAHINRMGFTAELGYEIMVPVEQALALWDGVAEAGEEFGVLPCAAAALMMVRVEAGMIMAELEYDDETSPYECRMGWAVDLEKPHFHGKAALVALKGAARRTIVSIVIDGDPEGLDGAPITLDATTVGSVTMAVPSPTLGGRTLALARLAKGITAPGQTLVVSSDAGDRAAHVVATPVYDPERTRLRS
jgi:aminomethyltransferase